MPVFQFLSCERELLLEIEKERRMIEAALEERKEADQDKKRYQPAHLTTPYSKTYLRRS
jgi:hypothetical protein